MKREAEHSVPSSGEVKNIWSCTLQSKSLKRAAKEQPPIYFYLQQQNMKQASTTELYNRIVKGGDDGDNDNEERQWLREHQRKWLTYIRFIIITQALVQVMVKLRQ
jgi:hypothetical protein